MNPMDGTGAEHPTGLNITAAAERFVKMPRGSVSEDRIVGSLVIASAALHLFVLLVDFSLFRGKPPILLEDTVDIDLVTDLDLEPPAKTTLPDSKQAEEAKVPAQLLPQLTKQYSVKEETRPEDDVAEEKAEEKPVKDEEVKPAEQPVKTEETVVKTDNKTDNPLEQKELLKRAALERLRKEAKFSDKPEAPEKGTAAAIAAALNAVSKKAGGTTGSASAKGRANAYATRVKKAVQTNYAVPEAYNLRNATLQVALLVTVSERGDLLSLDVETTSGDSTFDEMALQAVRSSTPLPQPPKELVGEQIKLVFTPRTL